MTPKVNSLETDDYDSKVSSIQFPSASSKKNEDSLSALHEIQSMFREEKIWKSEEEMCEEMAEFRRERLK